LRVRVATRALEGVLVGTSPTDPTVFTAVVVTLAVVARVDPVVILRDQ
jgi:hypothetical protein